MELQIIKSKSKPKLTIITTVKDPEIYQRNVLESTLSHKDDIEYISLYHNYSASVSLNTGLELASSNLIICCHQDIYFKDGWYEKLNQHITTLNNKKQEKWGVLGFAGSTCDGKMVGTHSGLSMGNEDIINVQTLDGSILILNNNNDLRFDENLKHFHMYDVDICLQSNSKGFTNYCINVPINHISYKLATEEGYFLESVKYIKEKWEDITGLINSTVGCINYMA